MTQLRELRLDKEIKIITIHTGFEYSNAENESDSMHVSVLDGESAPNYQKIENSEEAFTLRPLHEAFMRQHKFVFIPDKRPKTKYLKCECNN